MDEARVRFLHGMVGSPGWAEVYRPILEQEAAKASAELERSIEERAAPKRSDEDLRGYLRGLKFALHRVEDLLKEASEQDAIDRIAEVETESVGSPYRDTEAHG